MGWTEIVNETEYIGDEGMDAASNFVNEMIRIYERKFNRPPSLHEVEETVKFVYSVVVETHYENHPPHP